MFFLLMFRLDGFKKSILIEIQKPDDNIDRRGRIIRAVMTLVLIAAASIAHREGVEWLAIILAISALVGVVEVSRGWCLLRACKIKTRF